MLKNTRNVPMKEKIVVLQVDVPISYRIRLRVQALKLGMTMGELLVELTQPLLKSLEEEDE
jgi:hypothetical protein